MTNTATAADLGETISATLNAAIDTGVAAGFYVMTAEHGTITYSGGAGTRDGHNPWTADTIAWLASMTKPIVAVAALQLVERGLIGLDDPTTELLPELAAARVLQGYDGDSPILVPAETPVTLRMLLSHTAGAGYSFLDAKLARYLAETGVPTSLELKLSSIVDCPLVYQPGTETIYGNGLEWVGLAITRLTERDLASHLRDTILGPLGMNGTAFGITDRSRLAGTHAKTPDGLIPVAFELPANPEIHSAGGGLYGTPQDYLAFLRALGTSSVSGTELLHPETLTLAQRSHSGTFGRLTSVSPATSHDIDLLPGIPCSWSLLGMRNELSTPQGRPPGTTAWAGGANTYFWADTDGATAGVLFTQLVPFADPEIIAVFAAIEQACRSSRRKVLYDRR